MHSQGSEGLTSNVAGDESPEELLGKLRNLVNIPKLPKFPNLSNRVEAISDTQYRCRNATFVLGLLM